MLRRLHPHPHSPLSQVLGSSSGAAMSAAAQKLHTNDQPTAGAGIVPKAANRVDEAAYAGNPTCQSPVANKEA